MKKEVMANVIIACSGVMTILGAIGEMYGKYLLDKVLESKK